MSVLTRATNVVVNNKAKVGAVVVTGVVVGVLVKRFILPRLIALAVRAHHKDIEDFLSDTESE